MLLIKNQNLISRVSSWILILSLSVVISCGGGGSSSTGSSQASTNGQGGSMARFSIIGDYLYTISGSNLKLFSINDLSNVNNVNAIDPFATVAVTRGIETLYSSGNYLFIGAENGVYIFDSTVPSNPTPVSKFLHVASCDPVVVKGVYAYVTLSSGGGCRFGQNRLDVLDLTDIYNPILVKSIAMLNPKGLGIQDNLLFVCDGAAGLKVFELNQPDDPINPGIPVFKYSNTKINCYDLIPFKNLNNALVNNALIDGNLVISDDSGILQYKYNVDALTKVSEIKNTPVL